MYKIETFLGEDRLPIIEKQKICEQEVLINNQKNLHRNFRKQLYPGKWMV